MIPSFVSYLENERRYSTHTVVAYKSDLQQFTGYINTHFHEPSIDTADYNHIRTWLVHLIETKIEPRSINRKVAALKSYYKFLQKQGIIQKNPASRIKAPKVKKRLPEFITPQGMQNLLNHEVFHSDFASLRDKLVIELLYGTGLRLSELINIAPQSVNIYDRTLKVKGKGNKERIVPIHDELLLLINNYNNLRKDTFIEADNYLILTDKGTKTYPVFIQRMVKRYLTLVSTADKKSPHVLRHTFATHMLNKGAELNAIKELLGHANLAATQVYTHNSLEKIKNIFNNAHPRA
ncbi:MAG: tyrosine-type recombinase/integrase [Cytophagales bacterium]|nr:tyrosine-type recombinase/integrase [Cytophagales bacterium]